MDWFRFYGDDINNLKLKRIARAFNKPICEVVGVWACLECLASNSPERGKLLCEDGEPLTLDDIAATLDLDTETTYNWLTAFKNANILDCVDTAWFDPNWDRRQYASDSSAERMRRYRSNKKQVETSPLPESDATVTSPLRNTDATVTPQIQIQKQSTDTETEAEEIPQPSPSETYRNNNQDSADRATARFCALVPGWRTQEQKNAIKQNFIPWINQGYTPADIERGLHDLIDGMTPTELKGVGPWDVTPRKLEDVASEPKDSPTLIRVQQFVQEKNRRLEAAGNGH